MLDKNISASNVRSVNVAKKKLIQYRDEEREIDNQIERYDRLVAKIYSISSPEISDMPKSPSPVQDKIAVLISRKESLEKKIRHLITRHDCQRQEIESVLSTSVESADQRAVIRMRYIDGEKWLDITNEIFGSKDDYIEKEETYLRTVHNLHGRALSKMNSAFIDDV